METAGGVRLALERGLLDWDAPFALVNGDILTDYDFGRLRGGLGEDRGDMGDKGVAVSVGIGSEPAGAFGGGFFARRRGAIGAVGGGELVDLFGCWGVFAADVFGFARGGICGVGAAVVFGGGGGAGGL